MYECESDCVRGCKLRVCMFVQAVLMPGMLLGSSAVEVRLNGMDWTAVPSMQLFVYARPVVHTLIPQSGPLAGGTGTAPALYCCMFMLRHPFTFPS